MADDHRETRSSPMPLLWTERLLLRPFDRADISSFAAYRSDPEVARYQGWTAPFSLEQATAFVDEMQHAQAGAPGVWYQLTIERQDAPGIIGDCAFHVLAEDARQAEIGCTLARRFHGQGYAGEALRRLLAYLFDVLGLHRVIALCDTDNRASAALLARLGMRCEGHLIENVWFKGAWGSEYQFAILDREWAAQTRSGA
ncbi:MAG: GNAT family N-acetyltransferase [Anaerolineae bacterium]